MATGAAVKALPSPTATITKRKIYIAPRDTLQIICIRLESYFCHGVQDFGFRKKVFLREYVCLVATWTFFYKNATEINYPKNYNNWQCWKKAHAHILRNLSSDCITWKLFSNSLWMSSNRSAGTSIVIHAGTFEP